MIARFPLPASPPAVSLQVLWRRLGARASTGLWASSACVFLVALLALGWNIEGGRIAAAYADPIAGVRAQDESVYVSSAIRMAEGGSWLTPEVMGRLLLAKPPLLQWLSASAIDLFGLGLLSVRLPSLLFGAAGVAAVFAWASLGRTSFAGLIAALLLVSNPIWATFARLCYTDVLGSALALLAICSLAFDPALRRRRSRWLFGLFAGAAVMAKGIIGALPFFALGLYFAAARREDRPAARHALESLAVCLLVALPWHVYQLIVHRQWLLAESIFHQLIAVGVTETTGVRESLFYVRRLLAMDPALCILLLLGVGGAYHAWRRREPVRLIALCWTAVVVAALAVFRGRSVSYLTLLVPGLCVLAALYLPRFLQRASFVVVFGLVATFAVRAAVGNQPWSLRYDAPRWPSAAAMRWYYDQNRDAELIIAQPDDEFYGLTLPLKKIRYCLLGARDTLAALSPHFLYLGIAVSAKDFAGLAWKTPEIVDRLRAWGLDSQEPVATAILLDRPEDIRTVVEARPEADFYLPESWRPLTPKGICSTHDVVPVAGRVFLLARNVDERAASPQPLPAPW